MRQHKRSSGHRSSIFNSTTSIGVAAKAVENALNGGDSEQALADLGAIQKAVDASSRESSKPATASKFLTCSTPSEITIECKFSTDIVGTASGSSFIITKSGANVKPTKVSTKGDAVSLTFAATFARGETISIAYDGTSALQGANGETVAAFSTEIIGSKGASLSQRNEGAASAQGSAPPAGGGIGSVGSGRSSGDLIGAGSGLDATEGGEQKGGGTGSECGNSRRRRVSLTRLSRH